MKQEINPSGIPPSPADDVLRGFYRRYKAEHTPPQDVFARIYATIPESSVQTKPIKTWLERLRQFWHWGLASLVVGTCGMLLWWNVGQYPMLSPQNQPQVFVPKGQGVRFSLLHARRTPQGYLYQQTTQTGERLQAGDGVQLSYAVPQVMHVMLVSVNEQGDVSVFVPFGQQHSLSVRAGQGTLPQHSALTLDDYVGLERFFFVYRHNAFSLDDIKRSVQQEFARVGRSLRTMTRVPGSWQSQTLLIEKVKSL